MSLDTDRIRTLSDELRKRLPGGGALITPGVAALGSDAVRRLAQTIATFDDFCIANDPYSEHDFGCFDFDGAAIVFKIDYYDRTMNFQSSDAAVSAVSKRTITIMLAEEY